MSPMNNLSHIRSPIFILAQIRAESIMLVGETPAVGDCPHQPPMISLCPVLKANESGFNWLTKADLTGEEGSFRAWAFEREKSSIHLLRIGIDLRSRDRCGQFLKAVRRSAPSKFTSKVPGLAGKYGLS